MNNVVAQKICNLLKSYERNETSLNVEVTLSGVYFSLNLKEGEIFIRYNAQAHAPYKDEPINMEVILRLNGASYLYLISESEPEELDKELDTINGIVNNLINSKYSFVTERVLFFFNNTYMRMDVDGEEVKLLRTHVVKKSG